MTEPSVAVNINTLLLGAMTMIGTAFGAWLTYRANATHKAVNSERTAMTEELKKQNLIIAQLAAHLGAVTGASSLVELAKQVAPGLPIPPAPLIAVPAQGGVVAQIVVPTPIPPGSLTP